MNNKYSSSPCHVTPSFVPTPAFWCHRRWTIQLTSYCYSSCYCIIDSVYCILTTLCNVRATCTPLSFSCLRSCSQTCDLLSNLLPVRCDDEGGNSLLLIPVAFLYLACLKLQGCHAIWKILIWLTWLNAMVTLTNQRAPAAPIWRFQIRLGFGFCSRQVCWLLVTRDVVLDCLLRRCPAIFSSVFL